MLDREKLAKDVFSLVERLFPDLHQEVDLARLTLDDISNDGSFAQRVAAAQSSFLVPYWDGRLTDTFDVASDVRDYTVLAVDGSQIYPDRHVSGAGCFLVNTGGIELHYALHNNAPHNNAPYNNAPHNNAPHNNAPHNNATQGSSALFFSQPHVLLPNDVLEGIEEVSFSRDLVDLKREEYEFAVALERICGMNAEVLSKQVCFFDGTIIFWMLEGKPAAVKNFFLARYLGYLDEFAKRKALMAGYISMPKSRELVSLIKLGLCRFPVADCIACHRKFESFPCKKVDHMLDTHIARFFLKEGERTTVFYSTSKIVEEYPDHLFPAFVYCDVGAEIVRLEVPAWIARDRQALDRVCAVAIDQSRKGRGYPVCLSEAHEQAVVKGGDREFFYHLLCKIGIDGNRSITYSEKSMKKRRIEI